MSDNTKLGPFPIDFISMLAVSMMATSLMIAFHEGVHALSCILLGDTLIQFSALHVHCINQNVFTDKFVAGSAPVVNIILGLILWWLLRRPNNRNRIVNFFIWLFMVDNLLNGAGYFMFSGIANIGDMAVVIAGWEPAWLWRVIMTIFGTAAFMFSVYIALKEMGRLIGGLDREEQIGRFIRIGWIYYVGAIIIAVGAATMNSEGIGGLPAIAGILAVLGALSPFLWMPQWFKAESFEKLASSDGLILERNWILIIIGIAISAIYVFLLGPGLHF